LAARITVGVGFFVEAVAFDAAGAGGDVADADRAVGGAVVVVLHRIKQNPAAQVCLGEVVPLDLFGPGGDAGLIGLRCPIIKQGGEFEYLRDFVQRGLGGVDVHSVVTSFSSSLRASS
jgi:hypothetical protein